MSHCNSTTTSSAAYQGGATTITALHPDIIQTHILTRLDGPTLASTSCSSSLLHALSTEENLWKDICNSTWPSTTDPRVRDTISTFSDGHRSFYADSFPDLHYYSPSPFNRRQSTTSEFIWAVDIHYQNTPIFSNVRVTETLSGWFLSSPFRLELLDPKESAPTPVKFDSDEDRFLTHLEDHMTLSWIAINPTQKRAVNLSTMRPVSVDRHWLTEEVQLRYATIVAGNERVGEAADMVKCEMMITCGGKEGGDMHVREVSMQVEDMDGKVISGKESLVILKAATENGKKRKGKAGEEKQRYKEYELMRRERREEKQRRERRLDMVCIVTGVTIFATFWAFILLRLR